MSIPAPSQLFEHLRQGDRAALARAITLVESRAPKHSESAAQLIEMAMPHAGNSLRIGITGVPGVGKSTFIDVFGSLLTEKGQKIAVLAIDPSSARTGGSILGDKTRMERLSMDPNAYIRPSPAGATLGGVARNSWEAMVLCEAAGFDTILIETVGVGQSEIAVHGLVDFFLLLLLAGAGDELQGIKRGIMEMADMVVINKAEGDNLPPAKRAAADYRNALHLFPPHPGGWVPEVALCSATEGSGIAEIWQHIERYCSLVKPNGYFKQRRSEQALQQFREHIRYEMENRSAADPALKKYLEACEAAVIAGQRNPFEAARSYTQRLFTAK